MKNKKKWLLTLVLLVLSVSFTIRQISTTIIANFTYEKSYGQFWELGVKSSSIDAKAGYIDDFFIALVRGSDEGKFATHNAVFLKQPNNGFFENLTALHTLSKRLSQIKGMNPSTFEYNTAIQQITAQEQGEAHAMLSVFQGCYDLANYSNVWDWYCSLWILTIIVLWILTIVAFFASANFNWT